MKERPTGEAVPVITVDGPSGSGKGTVSRHLARRLGWHFLDSGALYRVLAVAAARAGVAPGDEAALGSLAERMDVVFDADASGAERVMLDGADVSRLIRTESCGDAASRIAALGGVRRKLLDRQRAFRTPPGLVADGRDMGTVVFPDATVKIFLTASPEERALRRFNQLKNNEISVDLARIVAEVRERDKRDSERKESPLRPARDARILDSTAWDIEETLRRALEIVDSRLNDGK
jgi:cytidylate kinase